MSRKIQKLNSMPDYQARMPKYGHDISRSWTFGIAPGMIAPVYGHPVMSGSHLKGQHKVFARFNPILKPFLGAVDIHVDTFFVPISMLYTPSLSLFYQTDDLISSNIVRSDLVKDRFPLIDIDGSIDDYVSSYCISGTNINYDQPQGAHGSYVVSAGAGVFECAPKSSIRFLDFMRLSSAQWFRSSYQVTDYHNPNIFPWYPLAYQCVYQNWDKYRNSDREQKVYAYNLDNLYDSSTPSHSALYIDDLFTMRYADNYKDYFTSVKVSPIGSSVSMLGGSSSWDLLSRVNSYLFDGSYPRVTVNGSLSSTDSQLTTVRGFSSDTTTSGRDIRTFTSANIRQLFMVDKLLRVTGRAEKNYESQFLAHFGVKIPHDYQHNITHVAHSVGTLTAEPVISSSDTFTGTTGSSLGEVGGQGSVLFKGEEFSFDVPCHGFIITNIVFMPRYRYFMGIDRLYDLSSPDKWWQPELDKIGMQPMFEYEIDPETYGATPVSQARRLGWQFGYEHLKRKPSGASIHFLAPWNGSTQNLFAPWVLSSRPFHHRDFQNNFVFADPVFYWSFKVPPTAMNGVSEVMYNGLIGTVPTSALSTLWDTRHTIYQSDPFIVDFTQDLSDLNFMSEYSEPELG